ncbi:uncharacterized protein FFB14_06346 [Fusarium fujikuroi]|nr:uncharacterized protein FFB14_06346 [Fusarium fujikuroi]
MRVSPRLLISGRIQVFNSWPKPIAVTSVTQKLETHLPSQIEVPTAIPTPISPVKFRNIKTFEFWLSSFIELRFKESFIKYDVNWSSCKVGHLEGPLGQAVSIIAPTVPKDSDGCDYNLSVLAGPDKLRVILDSILQANKYPIIELLKEKVSQIKDISADRLECSFAAVSKQGHNGSWNMDMVLNFSGTIKCDPHDWVPKLNIAGSNMAAHLGLTIDTTQSSDKNPQAPHIHVHHIQFSYESIFGITGYLLTSKFGIPSLNSAQNKGLLEFINGKLSDSLSRLGNLAKLEAMEPYNLSTIPQTLPSQSDFKEWMSRKEIQWKQLGQLKIPGTHNSAAYKFDRVISPMLEADTKVIGNIRPGTAPSGHRLDDSNKIYIGDEAYNDLIDHIALLSQAHDESKTLKKQLEDGIRFLDLRIYRDEDGDYYNQHFLRGPKLDELLDQIKEFLEEHNSSSEFIIVELAQCNYGKEHGKEVADKIEKKLGQWLYMPSDAETNPGRYDFQTLYSKRLSSITDGKPKVLFVSRTSWLKYPHSVLNVEDKSLEDPGNSSPLLPRWFTKVPSNGEEVAHILLNTFDPDARIKNLRHRAYEQNAEVKDVLSHKNTPWRYMMDWYTDCMGVEKSEELPVERIIRANM